MVCLFSSGSSLVFRSVNIPSSRSSIIVRDGYTTSCRRMGYSDVKTAAAHLKVSLFMLQVERRKPRAFHFNFSSHANAAMPSCGRFHAPGLHEEISAEASR